MFTNVLPGIHLTKVKIWIELNVLWNLGTCWYFLRLAWAALRGKVVIVDSKPGYSVSGFRYAFIVLSKLPMGKERKYDDLFGEGWDDRPPTSERSATHQ